MSHKDFNNWNSLKKQLEKKAENKFFHEREVWWCSLGINIGHEEDGKNKFFERPVLVLRKFNRNILWILPLTSRVKSSKYFLEIKFKGIPRSIMLSQIKCISSKRLLRRVGRVKRSEFKKTKNLILGLLLENYTDPSVTERSSGPRIASWHL
jgi:mRNA interferase MazF